jgi:hypothetical protein
MVTKKTQSKKSGVKGPGNGSSKKAGLKKKATRTQYPVIQEPHVKIDPERREAIRKAVEKVFQERYS